eukprot:TRINITY_DN1081_c0_g1_i1.p1 TRINITY_DN1081_c0_g1~~TRINITY_DN1081_c0_g1_i1.p1  ORF type:complete len:149 (-),score=18.73 TRINITY_DN1081_c0_g1_i1:74-520(-)
MEQEIITTAVSLGAPVTKSAGERLDKCVFGKDGIARKTVVILINRRDETFNLTGSKTESGILSSNALPPNPIPPRSTEVCSFESNGLLTGCTGCKLEYQASNNGGVKFWIVTSNPYIGKVSADCGGNGVTISKTVGGGEHNVVRFIIE